MNLLILRAGTSVCLLVAVICSTFLPVDVFLNDILSFEKLPSFCLFPVAAVGATLIKKAVKMFYILSINDK